MVRHPSYGQAEALLLLADKTIQKRLTSPPKTAIPTNQAQEETNWQNHANCLGLTHKMFPKTHKDITYITDARQICRTCDVKQQCLQEALQYPPTDMNGIWAGLTPRQLAAKQQQLGITPTKPTIAQIWNNFTKLEQRQ